MRELPQVLNSEHSTFFNLTTNGCDNPRLDAFAISRGWNPATAYPVPDTGTGLGSDTGLPNLFQDAKFYGYMYWGDLSNPSPQWDSKEQACQSQVLDWAGSGAAEYARCTTCLGTKGYYKVPVTTARDTPPLENLNFMFWGRFLNFNPPKYVTAKAALKSVIKDVEGVRVGISHFGIATPSTVMLERQSPSCEEFISNPDAFDDYRDSYINAVNGLTFATGTPLARSLLNVGYYFTSDDSVYRDRFGFGSGFVYPDEFLNEPLTSPGRSVCWGGQVSAVIILTDSEPSGDTLNNTVVTKLRTLNNGPVYCPDSAPCGSNLGSGRDWGSNYAAYADDNPHYLLDDVAQLLYGQDLQFSTPPVVGDFDTTCQQSVSTYTVGFGTNSNLLRHTAEVGGGLFYTADDAPSLRQALLDIITHVRTRTSSSRPAPSTR